MINLYLQLIYSFSTFINMSLVFTAFHDQFTHFQYLFTYLFIYLFIYLVYFI